MGQATAAPQDGVDVTPDTVHRLIAVDLEECAPCTIVLKHFGGPCQEARNPVRDCSGIVVAAMHEIAPARRAEAGCRLGVQIDVERSLTSFAEAAAREPTQQDPLGHIQEECSLDAAIPGGKCTIQEFSLGDRARESVEQDTVRRVRQFQAVQHHLYDQIVRNEVAVFHVATRGLAQICALSAMLPKQITGGDIRDAERLADVRRLRAFSCSWAAD